MPIQGVRPRRSELLPVNGVIGTKHRRQTRNRATSVQPPSSIIRLPDGRLLSEAHSGKSGGVVAREGCERSRFGAGRVLHSCGDCSSLAPIIMRVVFDQSVRLPWRHVHVIERLAHDLRRDADECDRAAQSGGEMRRDLGVAERFQGRSVYRLFPRGPRRSAPPPPRRRYRTHRPH